VPVLIEIVVVAIGVRAILIAVIVTVLIGIVVGVGVVAVLVGVVVPILIGIVIGVGIVAVLVEVVVVAIGIHAILVAVVISVLIGIVGIVVAIGIGVVVVFVKCGRYRIARGHFYVLSRPRTGSQNHDHSYHDDEYRRISRCFHQTSSVDRSTCHCAAQEPNISHPLSRTRLVPASVTYVTVDAKTSRGKGKFVLLP